MELFGDGDDAVALNFHRVGDEVCGDGGLIVGGHAGGIAAAVQELLRRCGLIGQALAVLQGGIQLPHVHKAVFGLIGQVEGERCLAPVVETIATHQISLKGQTQLLDAVNVLLGDNLRLIQDDRAVLDGDIAGNCYVCVILDLLSRKVLAY